MRLPAPSAEAADDVDETAEVHLHAGGQGFWVARMLAELGTDVVFCATFGGDRLQVTRTHTRGVDGALQGQLTAAGNVVIDRMVRDVPLYTFKPEDLRYGGVQFIATAIRTTPTGLSVRVEPAPAR